MKIFMFKLYKKIEGLWYINLAINEPLEKDGSARKKIPFLRFMSTSEMCIIGVIELKCVSTIFISRDE